MVSFWFVRNQNVRFPTRLAIVVIAGITIIKIYFAVTGAFLRERTI